MFKYIDEKEKHVLYVPELNNLSSSYAAYNSNRVDETTKVKFYTDLNEFFNWYISYCDHILKGKKYDDKIVAEFVFRDTIATEREWKDFLLKSIYISKEYIEYLSSKITKENIGKYRHTITDLKIDLEELIVGFEVGYKKTIDEASLTSGRRKDLTPSDLFSAARELFFIEEADVQDLYLRDLKPVVMFQIRQLLEVYGRNIIGYHSIVDTSGNPIKKFTQIAWDFIKEETKKNNSRIQLPFNLHTILEINTWANSFVHSTFLYSSYIQFFALKAIGVLFRSNTSGIKIYNGKTLSHTFVADIKITEYNSLKVDFENYLKSKIPNLVVEWLDITKVGAYVISV
jgi:hypothetical protein